MVVVTRTYLELRSPHQLRRADLSDDAAIFVRRQPCPLDHYRALYRTVGEAWHWSDRLAWTDEQLRALLSSLSVALWELHVGEEIAGYAELQRHEDGAVEIAYFGLLARFFGRRLGAGILTAAVDEAWRMGANRVWLHTCTLDSPHALPNYLARGFTAFDPGSSTTPRPRSASRADHPEVPLGGRTALSCVSDADHASIVAGHEVGDVDRDASPLHGIPASQRGDDLF